MKKYDHVVIGMGMSALGVLEALSQDKSLSILVVDIEKGEDEVYIKNNLKFNFGKVGDGGNSDLWHGVVSKLSSMNSIEYDKNFDSLLNIFYPGITSTLLDNYSFIPFKPLRPKNIIKERFKNKIDIIYDCLNYFEYRDSHVDLFFSGKVISTNKLWLCTGSQGTLKILNSSKLLKEREYFLDEHMVGYFGQIGQKETLRYGKIIYSKMGHCKPFVTVKNNSIRPMYLNIRPAHFGFKNLDYASSFRNFFGQSTKDIISKLFSKFNPALLLEALYNKFGVVISSSIYNIVGHIEIERAIKFDVQRNEFSLSVDEIKLSESELDTLKSLFGNQFVSSNPIFLSPGIHLINLDKPIDIHYLDDDLLSSVKSSTSVFICGGLSLKIKSPEHPTFSLLVYSFLKAKKCLENKS